jgi:uncharacterized protein with ACT and thioredoxin-like domain
VVRAPRLLEELKDTFVQEAALKQVRAARVQVEAATVVVKEVIDEAVHVVAAADADSQLAFAATLDASGGVHGRRL